MTNDDKIPPEYGAKLATRRAAGVLLYLALLGTVVGIAIASVLPP